MKLFRWRKKKREQDAAVYHIASLLDEGVISVDQLLAPGIWEDFPETRLTSSGSCGRSLTTPDL